MKNNFKINKYNKLINETYDQLQLIYLNLSDINKILDDDDFIKNLKDDICLVRDGLINLYGRLRSIK